MRLGRAAEEDPRLHLVDGAEALPAIAACDLFVTDIASTLLTAVSFGKPVLFVPLEHDLQPRRRVDDFQCGDFLDDVTDLRAFVARTTTPSALRELLASCVTYDDEENCERLGLSIREAYERWRRGG